MFLSQLSTKLFLVLPGLRVLLISYRKSDQNVLQDHARNFQDSFQDSYQDFYPEVLPRFLQDSSKLLTKIRYKILTKIFKQSLKSRVLERQNSDMYYSYLTA